MRKIPQVTEPDGRMGMNLFMCIPPDHMRDDMPSAVDVEDVCRRTSGRTNGILLPVYVGVTDDLGNTVTLPCFDVQCGGGRVVLMAHRTGRRVGP